MKSYAAKYTYPLVILAILVSVALQVVWLSQLFGEQRGHIVQDIDNMFTNTAKKNLYLSCQSDSMQYEYFHEYFLSPEWVQIRQGFDDTRGSNISKGFEASQNEDSSVIVFRLTFRKNAAPSHGVAHFINSGAMQDIYRTDSISLVSMNKLVAEGMRSLGFKGGYSHRLYPYGGALSNDVSDNKDYAYVSKRVSYNLEHLYKYQLLVTSLDSVVWYRMRYYVGSSVLMIVLTGVAFYYIIKLMRSRQLYADARVAFTSNMTHEIKTPIATVALALESIIKYNLTEDPEKLKSYLDIGRLELRRLDAMVEKVLSLSNNQLQFTLQKTFFDVQVVLKEVIRAMDLQFRNVHAECEFIGYPEPCFVDGDIVHITDVFYNLIENAIKYADKPLRMVIRCEADEEWTVISFKDNGPGIPDIYHEQIFERFFRVPVKGDIHSVKGSGLGLSYVKQIVDMHEGTINVLSEPGKGSTFIIKLPSIE